MTHKDLCKIAAVWLNRECIIRCPVVFTELVTLANETPDAIGFTSQYCVVVEVKTSKSDFRKDRKKLHRQFPEMGMGDYRFYLCPEGVLNVEDMPDKWGLVWVDFVGRCTTVKPIMKGNAEAYTSPNRFLEKNLFAERAILYSALRRMAIKVQSYEE